MNRMNRVRSTTRAFDEIDITGQLALRPFRAPSYAAECVALKLLARQLAADPPQFWNKIAELMIYVCRAHSAGVVLHEPGGLRVAGLAVSFAQAPRKSFAHDDGFWRTVMRRKTIMLLEEPARYFTQLGEADPPVVEVLVVPWAVDDAIVGIIWAAAHTADKQFDAEDARLLEGMIPFACAAYRMNGALADASLSRETDRHKDEFLLTLAHELRNPLASISNVAQLLRTDDADHAPGDVLGMLDRQVYQVTRLVDDLLDVSRIARGKVELNLQPTALADVVRGAVETCMPLFEQKRQKLTVSLPDAPVVINADSVRLTQIISNLLHNAAKYSDAGAQAWLTVSREAGESIVISVRDSGIGIPPEELRHVFALFAQAHRNTAGGQRGLGIGLTMVQKLAELHGGHVEAFSAGPGAGSEFLVHLPVGRIVDSVSAVPARANLPTLAGRLVIVVDDNRDAADSLAMWLESRGARAHACYDGALALAALERVRPRAMLVDLEMPGLDGCMVARRVRQDSRFDRVRLVAVTGRVHDSDVAHNAGFDYCVIKPVNLEALESWLIAHS